MRLLIITQYFWPESFRINDLASELVRRGFEVTVLTANPNYPEGKIFESFLECPNNYQSYHGSTILRVPHLVRGSNSVTLILNYLTFSLNAIIFGTWKLRKKNFDIIFFYQPSPITAGLPAIWFRFLKKVPLIIWVQDLWPDTLQALGVIKSKVSISALRIFVSFIYKNCDLILSQSQSFLPNIKKNAPPNADIRYFPNWAEKFAHSNEDEKEVTFQKKENLFNIIFAGNIGQAQDFPAILDAAYLTRDNKNIRWVLVGDGSKAHWVRQKIADLGLNATVMMVGRVPPESMPSVYSHAQALLISLEARPLFSQTIPSKMQTYLSLGIPILGMINGEGADLIRRSGAGLCCDAGDSVALANLAIEMSKLNVEKLREFGANAVQAHDNEFERDMLLSKLCQLMEEVIDNSR